MEGLKRFIRRFWVAFAILWCLLAVVAWQGSGSLVEGILSCVITSAISVWLLRWLLPERAKQMFGKEGFRENIRYGLPYLGAALVLLLLSVTRTPKSDAVMIDIGALITFPVLAAAEVFLICGPVLNLMMNRYGKDDVGILLSAGLSGLAYGLIYFAYSASYMISIEGASIFAVVAQAVYIVMMVTFLGSVYLRSENFYLVLVLRIVGMYLERGMELVSPQAVNLFTMVGLTKIDCILMLIIAAVLFFLALNNASSTPPWEKGDFSTKKRKKKVREALPEQKERLPDHRERRSLRKKK